MRDILADIESWRAEGKEVALATVIKVWGSAPRPPGSKMAISDCGEMAGSVSGGCVEGAVFEEAREVLATGRPKQVGYGVTNDEAWAVGLSCGGRIEIYIERLAFQGPEAKIYSELLAAVQNERLAALATLVDGPGLGKQLLMQEAGGKVRDLAGGLGAPEINTVARQQAEKLFATLGSIRMPSAARDGGADLFIETLPPRPKLLIVGAVHAAIPLVSFAKTLGMRTVVIDPRKAFATPERFPHADTLITDWPDVALASEGVHSGTYLALLSHDLKLDLPALRAALAANPRYIGALGSKRTHAKRVAALEEAGIPKEQIARIHNPIGLDLGGRRAEEIAVAVIAEIVAVSHGIGLR